MTLPDCVLTYRQPSSLDGHAYLTRYITQGGAFSYPGKASTVPALTLVCCRVCAGGCQSQTRAWGFFALPESRCSLYPGFLQHNTHVCGLQVCVCEVCFAHTTVLRYDHVTTLFCRSARIHPEIHIQGSKEQCNQGYAATPCRQATPSAGPGRLLCLFSSEHM